MNARKLILFGIALAALVAVPLLTYQRGAGSLRAQNEKIRQQTGRVAEVTREIQGLSNTLARIKQEALSEGQLLELAKLRNEVAQLRRSLAETNQLKRQIQRARIGLEDLSHAKERLENPLALLADELELREARVAQMKSWLEDHPEQKIPELQLLSDQFSIRNAEFPRITDEDFQLWIASQRARAVMRFGGMALKALKQYAQANEGQFPAQVAQLKPYFESPLDEAILERYQIVPAKSLSKDLADAGGDWVMTQKVPHQQGT